uniref:Protein-glutamine gamma-glutamyltransferase K n=1 Tax=Phasianus colchicus TaxID=9054 RepID=A0A669QX29_PHACC
MSVSSPPKTHFSLFSPSQKGTEAPRPHFRGQIFHFWGSQHPSSPPPTPRADRIAHHTADFSSPNMVVRRGQPFHIRVLLPRPFDPDDDRGTLGIFGGEKWGFVGKKWEFSNKWAFWGGKRGFRSKKMGIWGQKMGIWGNLGQKRFFFGASDPNLLLFGVFSPKPRAEDGVYMEQINDLNEYVLNETGRIFYGTEEQIAERSWNYGQKCGFFTIDRGGFGGGNLGDFGVNSLDDNGVLVGNWTGDYSQGTNPSAWAGSVEILRAYHRGGAPVRYGQCWVFAGVVTTVLRCLGIPTRTVTNYNSAHDTDVSLTTDIYFDENMKPLERLNTDSVWNFHVWNDCWMRRPDLPDGYDGWQVVDATPQETSSGLFCCGPCSVTAVRNGEVFLKYDTAFVFAEVNSDKVYWQRKGNGAFAIVHVEEGAIGRRISTVGPRSPARIDITHLYKHPEGSDEERSAVSTATSHGSRPRARGPASMGELTLTLGSGPAVAGVELDLWVKVRNSGSEPRSLRFRLSLCALRYTGVSAPPFRQEQHRRVVEAGGEEVVRMAVPYPEYSPHVGSQDGLRLTAAATAEETGEVAAKELRLRLSTPDLGMTLLGPAVVGQEVSVQVLFQNPLPQKLTGAELRMEGAGISCPASVSVGCGPMQTLRLRQPVVPLRAGRRRLVAAMESAQLGPVHGELQFDAVPGPDGDNVEGSGESNGRRRRRGRRRGARAGGSTGG